MTHKDTERADSAGRPRQSAALHRRFRRRIRSAKLLRSPLARRIILIFVLLLLPVFVSLVVLYQHSKSSLETHILNLKEKNILWLNEDLEKGMDALTAMQSEVLADRLINIIYNTYPGPFGYQQGRDIISIQTKLRSIEGGNRLVEGISLIYPSLDMEITGSSLNRPIRQADQTLLECYKATRRPIVETGGAFYAILSERVGSSDIYVVAARLSARELAKRLNTLRSGEEDVVVLIDGQNRELARSGDSALAFDGIIRTVDKAFQEGKDALYAEANSEGRQLIVLEARQKRGDLRLIHVMPRQLVFKELDALVRLFYLYAFFVLVMTVLLCIVVIRLIRRPLWQIQTAMERVEAGDFNAKLDEGRRDEFAYVFQQFNMMVRSIQYLFRHTYEKEILLQKAELKQLQSQINPHFLFNIYFTMHRMIRSEDYENALACSQYIGKYYEYIARNQGEWVELQQDWEHARNYLALQELRFADRLDAKMDEPPEELRHLQVPKLLIQPLIENVFEHAVSDGRPIVIRLYFMKSEGSLQIRIEDNGDRLNDAALLSLSEELNTAKTAIGALTNIRRRLQLQTDREKSFAIGRADLGGLRVDIFLPTEPAAMDVGAGLDQLLGETSAEAAGTEGTAGTADESPLSGPPEGEVQP